MTKGKSKTGVRVARDLVHAIYERGLQPGDHYLSESVALEEHGVSRATYREAMRFLELQGVLSVKAGPGGGAVVARPDWRNLASTVALLMQFSGTSLAQVMAARRILEPAMASASARNATDEQISAMRECITHARENIGDVTPFTQAYRSFWRLVAEATGNPLTAELWMALRAIIDSGGFVPNERFRSHLVETMDDLHRAISNRDADRAQALIETLDSEFAERLSRDYPNRMNKVIAWSDIDVASGSADI